MALFVAGKSGNESGRPKASARTVKGMVERFVKRNISPNKLSKIFEKLTEGQKADLLLQLLPYVIPKVPSDGINQEEFEVLRTMLEQSLKQNNHGKAV